MTGQQQQPQGSWSDWAADRAIRLLLDRMLARPYERRVPAMGRLMQRLAPVIGWRKRAETQLARIYPSLSASELRRISSQVADNAGRTVIENYSTQDLRHNLANTEPTGPGLKALEDAAAAAQPVVLVTGHFGNHEAPRHVLTRRGLNIGGLYRPMQNPYFNAHYVKTMEGWSGPVFPQGRRGTGGFARFLKGGGIGVLLFDVWTKEGDLIDFLGHPAPTSTAAAQLALRNDALLIPMYGVRGEDGLSFDISLDAPIPHSDANTMTRAITASLEARIAKNPEQWFWFHRRWKPERQNST